MSKLVLIDGNAILHRAYHALPSLTTRTGEPINAVYGLVSMLLRVIQDLKPTHIAVCFDRKEPTFRHKEYKEYQSHRPPTDKELVSQFEKAKDVLGAMNIPTYEMVGFEADDVIGTIARQSTEVSSFQSPVSNKNNELTNQRINKLTINEVIIVTGDKDILQLVDDSKKIRVYLPIRGLSDAKLMKSDDVVEKLGVTPDRIIDYKALVGDPSDNYKGVPGIGPKTAVRLLDEFGSFEAVYKWVDTVSNRKGAIPRKAQAQRGKLEAQKIQKALKGKSQKAGSQKTQKLQKALSDSGVSKNIFNKLVEGRESGEISYKLAQIVTDVKLKADLEKSKAWQVDNQRVLDLFTEFGFRTLKTRVKEVGKSIVSENQGELF